MTSHGYKQNEISQELSMGTKIFKTSYYTVLYEKTWIGPLLSSGIMNFNFLSLHENFCYGSVGAMDLDNSVSSYYYLLLLIYFAQFSKVQ